MKKIQIFVILILFIFFNSCFRYVWLDERKYFIIGYCDPNNEISYSYKSLTFAKQPSDCLNYNKWAPLDTTRYYIFLGDSEAKLDSIWFKPYKVYDKKVRGKMFICYRYNRGCGREMEYAEIYIENGKIVEMGFREFRD